jgi:hypothetical protein
MMRIFQKCLMLACLVSVLGCLRHSSKYLDVQLSVENRSDTDILSVVIDANGVGNHFGFFSKGGAGATAGGCQFRLVEDLTIEWEEGKTSKRAILNMKPYSRKRDMIKSFTFRYLGTDRWEVIAHAGLKFDSPVVLP